MVAPLLPGSFGCWSRLVGEALHVRDDRPDAIVLEYERGHRRGRELRIGDALGRRSEDRLLDVVEVDRDLLAGVVGQQHVVRAADVLVALLGVDALPRRARGVRAVDRVATRAQRPVELAAA